MAKLILAIDNESNILEVINMTLYMEGFEVITAADGAMGVALAQERNPQLILLDVTMPGMDGWQALKLLRESQAASQIPIYMLTGMANAADKDRASQEGATGYILKPFDIDKLAETVKAALGGS